jgi:hypothetical protein
MLLFSLMSYMPTAMNQEKVEGTVKFAFRFFVIAIVIEGLFDVLAFGLSFYIPSIIKEVSVGLWPILFCDIVIECNRSPDVGRG